MHNHYMIFLRTYQLSLWINRKRASVEPLFHPSSGMRYVDNIFPLPTRDELFILFDKNEKPQTDELGKSESL